MQIESIVNIKLFSHYFQREEKSLWKTEMTRSGQRGSEKKC